MRRASTFRRRAERGGAAAIVAVLLGGGALLGASALAIDVGSILSERRQLQNSADAATLALARACVDTPSTCKASNPRIASLARANTRDNSASTDLVCSRFTGTSYTPTASPALPACASASDTAAAEAAKAAGLSECLPLPAWLKGADGSKIPYVEVKSGTSTSGSTATALPSILSRAVTGSDNPHVTACARAAWGAAGSVEASLPLAISVCEWQAYTGSSLANGLPGTAVPPPQGAAPGYGGIGQPAWPDPYSGWPNKVGDELYVLTHSSAGAECSVNGKDTSGGFGWLADNANCEVAIQTNAANEYWAEIKTGNAVPNSCKSVIESYHGKVLQIPVFDCLYKSGSLPTQPVSSLSECKEDGGGGGTTWYHLRGMASFYLSGNKLTNSTSQNSKINGVTPCSSSSPNPGNANPWTGNSARCISGWFVSGTLTAPTVVSGGPGGGTFGTVAVALGG